MATPAVQRFEVFTRDQDEAAHLTESVFATGTRPRFRRKQRPDAGLRIVSATAGALTVDQARCGLNFQIDMEAFDHPAAFQVLEGWVRVETAHGDFRFGPGDVCLNPMGMPTTCEWEDLTLASLRLPPQVVGDLAAELTGIDPVNLRFDSLRPVSATMSRHWRRVAAYAYRELMAPDSAMDSPIAAAEVARMAAAATLVTFSNTSMSLTYQPDPGQVAPAAVRRAVAYIEAHAAEPLTLTEIAAAARVGPRALQYAFRRHQGTTPFAYLRRVRLARARQELLTADPTTGATVAAIAVRWGFTKPARFAALYRRTYAESPRATLHT